jgi:hypothetical protein
VRGFRVWDQVSPSLIQQQTFMHGVMHA